MKRRHPERNWSTHAHTLKSRSGFPNVSGPDTEQPNSQEILHLLAGGAGACRLHMSISHCVIVHTRRPYAATLVFTPTDMSACSYAGFPAQALLIPYCCWEPSQLAGFSPLPWPTEKSSDTGHYLFTRSPGFLLDNFMVNFIPCLLFRGLRTRVESLPVTDDTAIDWQTSAWVFSTALFRQDAVGLEEKGQKCLQNTSSVRGKVHQLE